MSYMLLIVEPVGQRRERSDDERPVPMGHRRDLERESGEVARPTGAF